MKTLSWTSYQFNNWKLLILVSDKGLCYVGNNQDEFNKIVKYHQQKNEQVILEQNEKACKDYVNYFNCYFNQQHLSNHNLTFDLIGTPFQQKVWAQLQNIPYGATVTYSQIAAQINSPTAVRAVGSAIGKNPILIMIPCHRVLAKNGDIYKFSAGPAMKKALLELEGYNLSN